MNDKKQISSDVVVISDNWLLQCAGEIIVGDIDSPSDSNWISVSQSGELLHHNIPRASIQFECLISLLEQIIFCDQLHVMDGWTHSWSNLIPEFEPLLSSSIISEFKFELGESNKTSSPFLSRLQDNPHIAKAYEKGVKTLKEGVANFDGQVVNGVIPYLDYAAETDFVYAPHPVRARFLERVLHKASYESGYYSLAKLNTLVDSSRIKYSKYVGINGELSSLVCKTSSAALLCLLESSKGQSPIKTALQMRDSSEFRSLRKTLHEFQKAISSREADELKHIDMLESAVNEVERRLKIRSLDNEDGFSELNTFFSLPVKVPNFLRRPLITPKHTTAVKKLVLTGKVNMRQLLKGSLGITDPKVVEGLVKLAHTDSSFHAS